MTSRITFVLFLAIAAASDAHLANAADLTYTTLNSNYSTAAPAGFREAMKRDNGEDSPNSCAIRLAFALEAVDSEFFQHFTSKPAYDNKPIRARDLADYLSRRLPGGTSIPTGADGRHAVKGRKGIVYFSNIRPRPGHTGVSWHISLWNGTSVVDKGDYFDRATTVQYWPLD